LKGSRWLTSSTTVKNRNRKGRLEKTIAVIRSRKDCRAV
jgi:hypothetical protein